MKTLYAISIIYFIFCMGFLFYEAINESMNKTVVILTFLFIYLIGNIEYYIKDKFLSNKKNIKCIKYNIPAIGYIHIFYCNIMLKEYIDLIPELIGIINTYTDNIYEILAIKTNESDLIPEITDEVSKPNTFMINTLNNKFKTIDLKIIVENETVTIYKITRIEGISNGIDKYTVNL